MVLRQVKVISLLFLWFFFAIKRKDFGIRARLTHSIPSLYRNINHIGIITKVIGHNPEPQNPRLYPWCFTDKEWTVYRLIPRSIEEESHIFWITFFDRDGFIASRPFSFSSFQRYPVQSTTDIAQVTATQITIFGKKVSFSELCEQVKGEQEMNNNYTEEVPNDRYSSLAHVLPTLKKKELETLDYKLERKKRNRRILRKPDLIDRITPRGLNLIVKAKRVQNNNLQSGKKSEPLVQEKSVVFPTVSIPRKCSICGKTCQKFDYSKNQWSKGSGNSKCLFCSTLVPSVSCDFIQNKIDQQSNVFNVVSDVGCKPRIGAYY